MNISEMKKYIKEKYNCQPVDFFKYGNHEFAKCVEALDNGINYRYFDITENIVEVTDEILLNYFKEKNEIHSDIEY